MTSHPSWRGPLAALLAVTGVVAVVVGLVGGLAQRSAAAEPVELGGVVLRWGLTGEANTASFQNGTFNFPSAGRSLGNGGAAITKAQWRQSDGDVSVVKWDGNAGAWKPATWAGLGTDSFGAPLVAGQRFSNHQVVFGAGAGTVDLVAGTARVAWTGSASVLFYSGQALFSFTDPVLEVAGGKGTLTATLSGFVSSRGGSVWAPAEPATVTMATFDVQLTEDGFTVTPDYAGVGVDGVAIPQDRTATGWGSFPPAFVRYLDALGSGAFWYSTGGAADGHKAALDITVAFSADGGGEPTPTVEPIELPTVDNTAPPPPTPASTTTVTVTAPAPPGAAPPVVPAASAPPVAAPTGAAAGALLARPATDVRAGALVVQPSGERNGTQGWAWWGAGVLLLAAAGLLLVPVSATRRAG